jgi:hypothetical protein
MKILAFVTLGLIYLPLAGAPALAQQRGTVPQMHALNPSVSLSAPVTNPLQAQIRQNYATDLMSQQRQMLQQNPSGVTRQELAVGHELNNFSPR